MTGNAGFTVDGDAPRRYERFNAPIMTPFVDALVGVLAPGDAVLDLACGTGFVARAARRKVGKNGRVAGADPNPAMLEMARMLEPGIEWTEATADRLPFPTGAFDAVLCQQGIQFFPDLDAAMVEAARVTRPGGLVAVTAWLPVERSDYMSAQLEAVRSILGPEGGQSFIRAFSCTEDAVTAAFRAGELGDLETSEIVAEVRVEALADFIPGQLGSIPWGQQIIAANAAERATSLILSHLAPDADGAASLTFGSLLVTARTPGGRSS